MNSTPKDSYSRPAVLGSFEGSTVPLKVTEDGRLYAVIPAILGTCEGKSIFIKVTKDGELVIPSILGNCNGKSVPFKVTEDGSMYAVIPAILGTCNGKSVPFKVTEDGELVIPSILGTYGNSKVPIRVTNDGKLYIAGINEDERKNKSFMRYELIKVLKLDLSEERENELCQIVFDKFEIVDIGSSLYIGIDSEDENKRLTINKCVSVNVTANKIYISNEATSNSKSEIWFFKLKEAV